MTVSNDIIDYIKQQEGFQAEPYPDNLGWSIGYGHYMGKGKSTDMPIQIIGETDAINMIYTDLLPSEAVLDNSGLVFSQSQYDALADFGYNAQPRRLKKVIMLLKTSGTEKAQTYMKSICHDHNGELQVLVDRRAYECDLFNQDSYDNEVEKQPKALLAKATFNPFTIPMVILIAYILTKIFEGKIK